MKHKMILWLLFAAQAIAAPWQFSADRLEYIPQENRARASGAVLFTREDLKLQAEEGDFLLTDESARLREVRGEAAGFFLKAGKVLATPSQTELYDSQLTGCSLSQPEYFLASRQVSITPERIFLKGNRLHLFNFPAIPLPSLSLPAGSKLPLPRPELGSSRTRGLWGGLVIPNFHDDNRHGSLTVLLSQRKGPILGQKVTYEKGAASLDFSLRWEGEFWGGTSFRSGPWQLVAERELWTGELDEALVKLPELSYSFQKNFRLFSVRQNFSLGNLREGAVADRRLRWQTHAAVQKELGNWLLKFTSFTSFARYTEDAQLAFSITGLLGSSWQLGEYSFAASVGGSDRKVSGASPFKHDRITGGSDFLFSSQLTKGPWQLSVDKLEDLREKAQWEIKLRKDGHCFYWQLGYAQRTGSVLFELGLR